MKKINVNIEHALNNAIDPVSKSQVYNIESEVAAAMEKLHKGTGAGNDFLGWLDLPTRTPNSLLEDINATADKLRKSCDVVVTIGIGGSYLGAKCVIEALSDSFASFRAPGRPNPAVVFAGHNIGEDYLHELQQYLEGKEFGIIVISKSGTTTEPAIAFRILKAMLEEKIGKAAAAERIVAVTDAKRGALRQLATEEGYKTYVIDDNVGGRFSVLSPVGLLPIAVAGYNIVKFVDGARQMEKITSEPGMENPAALYAATRNALYRAGKKIEILVNYNPKLHYVAEWWKQLYGESEGKDHKGIFPASVDNSTDLHSMGQWIQDGERTIFETVISVGKPNHSVVIPSDEANLDGLNYIAGKHVDEVNKMAELGTRLAHIDGGVPNLLITIDEISENSLGQLLYFFEKACGISGYLLDVNPFNQPGVEAYKRNMFALLEKPGYEKETEAIKARLK